MKEIEKKIKNGRMLKTNGSWMYCDRCDNTVGYLVYSTYQSFRFGFTCKCGSKGKFELEYKTEKKIKKSNNALIKKKNRLCCPNDEAPLFTVVEKNLERYCYDIICNNCLSQYVKDEV